MPFNWTLKTGQLHFTMQLGISELSWHILSRFCGQLICFRALTITRPSPKTLGSFNSLNL